MTIRILVTARDPGSAYQNKAFIQFCLDQSYAVEFFAIVEGVAIEIFNGLSVQKSSVYLCETSQINDSEAQLANILSDYNPDFVLLGLSGLGYGVDELARKYCNKLSIPCGAVQDYWGYIGRFSLTALPDYFFVIDKQAETLTGINTSNIANCIISGSPKHEAYKESISRWMSEKPLLCDKENCIVFIGQPSEINGIFFNFKLLVEVLNQIDSSVKLFFKPHPSDYGHIQQYENILANQSISYEIITTEGAIEPILCQANIVVTCFSTAGFDHNYLQYYAEQCIGNLIYLTIGDEITRFIESVVGIAAIPGAINGMGNVCKSKEELYSVINLCLQGNDFGYRESVAQYLGSVQSPSRFIYKFIQSVI